MTSSRSSTTSLAEQERETEKAWKDHDFACELCQGGRKPLCPTGFKLWNAWADVRRQIIAGKGK